MSDQQPIFLRSTDGAQVAQAQLNDVVVESLEVALCNELEHHFATWTIGLKATRDVHVAIDALP